MQANSEENNKIKELKIKFQNVVDVYKQSKKSIDITRKYEDEMIKKKRKREDELLSSKREEEDKKFLSSFDDISYLFREGTSQKRKNNSPKKIVFRFIMSFGKKIKNFVYHL